VPFALIQIPEVVRNAAGRHKVRQTLQGVLSDWAQKPATWIETPKGPIVRDPIREQPPFVSISYAAGEAWLGIALGESLGVDAVSLEALPDWEETALLYLGEQKVDKIRDAENPPEAFAREWASMEASLKRAGLSLSEHQNFPKSLILTAKTKSCIVAVALSSNPSDK
jgi:phosphopantetheinyl transferase